MSRMPAQPRNKSHIFIAWWMLLASTFATSGASAEQTAVILSPSNGVMAKLAPSISKALIADGIDSAVVNQDSSSIRIAHDADLVITTSDFADSLADDIDPSKLLAIDTDHGGQHELPGSSTHFHVQQQPCRIIALAVSLSERFRKIGIVTTDRRLPQRFESCRVPESLEFNIVLHRADDTIAESISIALESDVLLALPDNTIYNSSSVKNILLSAYRKRVPVIGFSPSFTRAGAIASLHSDIAVLADEISTHAYELLSGVTTARELWPEQYSISINKQVSRSLDISIIDKADIRRSIERMTREGDLP